MNADKFTYVSFSNAQAFGDQYGLAPKGGLPIYLFQNTKTEETMIIFGSDISSAKFFKNKNGEFVAEVLKRCISKSALTEFDKFALDPMDEEYLFDLIVSALYGDTTDFIDSHHENITFIEGEDVLNNEVISEFVGCDGVLAITKDHLKIILNELQKTLDINGKSITNLMDSFVVLGDGYPSAAILTSSAIGNGHSGPETTGELDEKLTDESAGTQDWDFKCNCCGWRGLADETKYDAEEDLSICPNCDDNELETNSQDGNIEEVNSSAHQPSTKYWDYSCAKCMWQGLDGETVFNDDNTPCCPSCNSPELNPNLDNSWDFKCNCCGWRGLADETKYDADEELCICPNCDDNELETK